MVIEVCNAAGRLWGEVGMPPGVALAFTDITKIPVESVAAIPVAMRGV